MRRTLHLLLPSGKTWGMALVAASLLAFSDNRPFANLSSSGSAEEAKWVDSIFNSLNEDERLGQLFVLRAHVDKDTAYEQEVEQLIRQYKPGGICFFNPTHAGSAEKQAELTNRYQAASPRIPLLVSADLENGLGMRLRHSTISFPRAMMLGAVQDNSLLYEMGKEVAWQCRRLGVHVNYAPVADVNNNSRNPVIGERSYGEDRHNVAAKAYQYMAGLQEGGVLACAKHFPGHGDTDQDSHYELPKLKFERNRLDSLELYPFDMLAQNGVGSFMIGHLQVSAIDNREPRPSSLSRAAVTDLLRKKMGFEGLIFTDAMEMDAVKLKFPNGSADVEAFKAGNDVLLLSADLPVGWKAVVDAISSGEIDRAQIHESVKRVLRVKYRLGLTSPQRVELNNLRRDLNRPQAYALKRRIIAAAMTLVNDSKNLIGFPNLENIRFASVAVGDTNRTVFQTYCGYYAPVRHFNLPKNADSLQQQRVLDSLRHYDIVLAGVYGMRTTPLPLRTKKEEAGVDTMYGVSPQQIRFIEQLNTQNTVSITVFGNPYTLRWLAETPLMLQAYTEDPIAQECAAQALFGAADMNGIMPVTATPYAHFGHGFRREFPKKRLGYSMPEAVGMSSDTLALMDALVQEIIQTGAAPGCQILVAKDNKIVWHKAYGYQTYEQTVPVTTETVFDLASVTKVAATTVSMMKLTETGKISLDLPMSEFIPELKNSNKKDLKVREIMAHHAGLQPWIPFYQQTVAKDATPMPEVYKPTEEKGFTVPVANNLFMKNNWVDSVWVKIFSSPLREDKTYKYSDLGLYLGARAVANLSEKPVDVFAAEQYYTPLGMSTTGYNPWKKGLTLRCAPTEEDGYFRRQKIQGYVHDMGAAMLGGVSGHAGLFSNANDLAKLFQMLLNGGNYGWRTYLNPETVRLFTTRFNGSTRRGIGFDMKELDEKQSANMSKLAGKNTFGHLGFTGTCVWADPDKKLIFIFLSNRTYPSMENNKLSNGDYRPKLQSIVYRAMAQGKNEK
ncbi:MAG: serine hydrolase [Saprospiraceae bacterium]|nr:serine hydrolase [Saprospiraceae bacterium]